MNKKMGDERDEAHAKNEGLAPKKERANPSAANSADDSSDDFLLHSEKLSPIERTDEGSLVLAQAPDGADEDDKEASLEARYWQTRMLVGLAILAISLIMTLAIFGYVAFYLHDFVKEQHIKIL